MKVVVVGVVVAGVVVVVVVVVVIVVVGVVIEIVIAVVAAVKLAASLILIADPTKWLFIRKCALALSRMTNNETNDVGYLVAFAGDGSSI